MARAAPTAPRRSEPRGPGHSPQGPPLAAARQASAASRASHCLTGAPSSRARADGSGGAAGVTVCTGAVPEDAEAEEAGSRLLRKRADWLPAAGAGRGRRGARRAGPGLAEVPLVGRVGPQRPEAPSPADVCSARKTGAPAPLSLLPSRPPSSGPY